MNGAAPAGSAIQALQLDNPESSRRTGRCGKAAQRDCPGRNFALGMRSGRGGGAERGLKNLAVIGSKVSLPFRTLGPSDTEAVDCCVAAGTRESPAETTH